MAEGKNRQWVLHARPAGALTGDEFRWNETSIPQCADGQVLVRNLWLSFDPTQRGWMSRDSYLPNIPLGEVMRAFGAGQVIESHRADFKPGDLVQGVFRLAGLCRNRRQRPRAACASFRRASPPNLALSLFGITGTTAYFGITEIGQIKAGETVVVSGAAGSHGLDRRTDRKDQGLPRDRHRRRHSGNATGWSSRRTSTPRSTTRAEDVGARLIGALPEGHRRVFRQRRRRQC